MANKGTVKYFSVEHEEYIAKLFQGRRSRSSGAAEHDAGDGRTERLLIECKMTGNPGAPVKRLPVFMQQLEKVAQEAWEEGKDPLLALRYYCPQSPLAGARGWVDVVVMVATEAAAREEAFCGPEI